jgi:hypothetical protein
LRRLLANAHIEFHAGMYPAGGGADGAALLSGEDRAFLSVAIASRHRVTKRADRDSA